MRRLLLVFGLLFFAGCNGYTWNPEPFMQYQRNSQYQYETPAVKQRKAQEEMERMQQRERNDKLDNFLQDRGY